MKKAISLLIALCLCFGYALAETVYVTISDDIGLITLAHAAIEVSDTDGDGAITLSDALYCAHEAAYPGGAAAGYSAEPGDYGIALNMLWGVNNGGSHGYYVNDASAASLSDPIAGGDHLRAYSYTDLVGWSDTYSCFDLKETEAASGSEVTLTLTAQGFDANWNAISFPVENALITIDGVDTEYKTDADGCVRFAVDVPGVYVVSAHADQINLVAPVCILTIH